MRNPIIGGNWKMNKGSPSEATKMLKELIPLVKKIKSVDIVVAPPFTALFSTIQIVKNTNIMVGAQNMYYEEMGAFTGEISPEFLKDLGCKYVILGHSERRDIFNETNDLINKKLKKALNSNLNPIVCIGEHLEERESGRTKDVIENQFDLTFNDLKSEELSKVTIAYEPIWAIGTGKTATPEQAEEIHIFIRELIASNYDKKTAEIVRIQYGGSIKPTNANELFKKENIDGGLVGGASLHAKSLYEIIKAAEISFNK
ncbi:MAG: triose-phosphate isomerase [Candidatus Lokiarchaeota archaeon]|nr:triose-phosphate isomerase [Candidatus Lokiarchaeota archaeon]